MTNSSEVIQKSALWAAYGDALGFITELSNSAILNQRAKLTEVHSTISWKRRFGGKFGIFIDLPAGCYSDDTQLRLAVSRSISSKGLFDVEAFSKVELPLWLSYQLGAGKGTEAAASNLRKKNASWISNFYNSGGVNYINSGGNGAAMRIQPHVWSFPKDGKKAHLIRDIVRNTITTHGHPRAIIGAVFHGLCLHYCIQNRDVPDLGLLQKLIQEVEMLVDVIRKDDELLRLWVPQWERFTKKNFADVCISTIGELDTDLEKVHKLVESQDITNYRQIVSDMDAMSPISRGSGTKSALLASILSVLSKGDVRKATEVAANTLGSDTDTIASMSGALLGCIAIDYPAERVCDQSYIAKEAERMYRVSIGTATQDFAYPDLLYWESPQNHLDAVGIKNGKIIFSSFGEVEQISEEYRQDGKYPSVWKWYKLSFGQSILIHHRPTIAEFSIQNSMDSGYYRSNSEVKPTSTSIELPAKYDDNLVARAQAKLSIDEAYENVRKSNFSAVVIGEMLLKIIDQNSEIDNAIAFAALVSKSRLERRKQDRNRR